MEDDQFQIEGLDKFAPGVPLVLTATHADGSIDTIDLNHSYSDQQIHWFKAGSALNYMKKR
jgi:aconitate hydratase